MLGEFPSVSETFILREMQGLRQWHGLEVLPVALRRGRAPQAYSELAREWLQDTLLRPPRRGPRFLTDQVRLALTRPAGYTCALRLFLTLLVRRPAFARELLSAWDSALYFGLRLPRGVRHVHAHFASQPATVALLLAEILGCGFSFSAHARDIFTEISHFLEVKIPEAEFVAVCSAFGRDYLTRKHPLTAAGKLILAYHGVDVDEYRPLPRPPQRPPVILSVGRLVEKKGFPILLRACGVLRSRRAQFRLVIIGDGPERADLLSLATGLGLQDHVEFRGACTAQEVRAALAEADVFALASIVAADGDRDGLPNVVLEALATGVPVVASDLSALPEAILPEQTGLLTRPGDPESLADALERMLYDEELRATVMRLGRDKVVREFRLERGVARLAELLEAVL